jgi:hypothetical protein
MRGAQNGGKEPLPQKKVDISFRPRRPVLLWIIPKDIKNILPVCTAKHEPERQLPGQRLCVEFLQNSKTGAGYFKRGTYQTGG